MNAHKVIEHLSLLGRQGKMDSAIADVLSRTVTDAVKFQLDFGEFPTLKQEAMVEVFKVLRLPFELCYFEIPSVGALIAREIRDYQDYILVHPFFKIKGAWGTIPAEAFLAIDKRHGGVTSLSPNCKKILDDMGKSSVGEVVLPFIGLVVRGIAVLNCSNVVCVDNDPPIALNRKRELNGKIPLFTFKTLHLKVNREVKPSMSGAEASGRAGPRLHLRRGHIRKLDDQRTTWVQSCMVGNDALGAVTKDYAVS